ncbi:DUF6046 domain-containing protein [Flammeovirga aprica]|uniref:DUF6046 domain-containing protein n=1 Tax=Flammeovirga aprica JL-4 TaxID=694437 RepID=A0A7X9RUL3_9BACT|nr:DUF6046 domain-containing protein [Flammeovirga aprica]NME69005.1 hypothetical protein [Flammeovirga aprica JL-4]
MADFNINNLTGGLYPTFAKKSAEESVNLLTRVKNGETRISEIFDTELYMPVKLDGEDLPLEPIITISSRKVIKRTGINRSKKRGTVKELFMEDDYVISIQGLLMDNTNSGFEPAYKVMSKRFPEQSFKTLRAICEKQQAVKIESMVTSLLNIEYIAIETYSFPGQKGTPDRQAYTIKGYSDQGSSTENIYSEIIKQLK